MKRPIAVFLLPLLFAGCDFNDVPSFLPENGSTDYPQEMRDLVGEAGSYARGLDSNFIVIAHGGIALASTTEGTSGGADSAYLNSIDGLSQDSVFYGYDGIDIATPAAERRRLRTYLDLALDNGNTTIMVTDFAFTQAKIDDSYELNAEAGYISFAADHNELDNIPEYPVEPFDVNRRDVDELFQAENFLVLTDTRLYSTRQELADAIAATDYDLVVVDFFFNGQEYTADQIREMQFKANGGRRLLIATMNIGEAEDNRFYWQSHWVSNPPDWLDEPVPGATGRYYVDYWRQGWQDLLYGNNSSYLYRIVNAGFDGVYMYGIDAYEYFEQGDTL